MFVKKKGIKDAWCLASNCEELTASKVIQLYSKRFTIEEGFRDAKDWRFGFGLSYSRIRSPSRRDRLIFLHSLSVVLLTLLGAAGEACGLSKWLKANTSSKRTYSLFNQGIFYYGALPNMKIADARMLMAEFDQLLQKLPFFQNTMEVI